MDHRYYWLFIISLAEFFPAVAGAQTAVTSPQAVTPAPSIMTATPQAVATEVVTHTPITNTEEPAEDGKPFAPHWTGQLGLNYSTQPTQQGQGQETKELSLTGTYNITESGHYLSVGITSGQQLLEGANTNYGEITGEGGLGLGIFQPSLSFAVQEGASALNSYSSTLNLNFEVLDCLTVGLTGGLGLENHQGPASQIYPNDTSNPNTILEVDTGNWTGGVVVSFVPWDFLTLSLTGEQETDYTFKTQGITHNNVKPINQSDQIPSLTLEGELTFLKDFQLLLSVQAGQEYYAAGTVYSPVTGKTQTFSQPTQENFTGYTLGLLYNFQ